MFHSRPTKKSRVTPVAPVFSDTLPPFVLGMPLPGDFRGFFPQQQSSFFTGPNPFSPPGPVTPRIVKRSLEEEEEEILVEPSAFKKRNIAPERNDSTSTASPAAAAVPESTRGLTPIVEEENLRVLKRSFEQMMGDNLDGDNYSRRVVHNGCAQQ